jgi:hypothetical protein
MFNLNYALSSGFVHSIIIIINVITLQLNEMTHWLYVPAKKKNAAMHIYRNPIIVYNIVEDKRN